jgi:hypothetical protein
VRCDLSPVSFLAILSPFCPLPILLNYLSPPQKVSSCFITNVTMLFQARGCLL